MNAIETDVKHLSNEQINNVIRNGEKVMHEWGWRAEDFARLRPTLFEFYVLCEQEATQRMALGEMKEESE